MKRFLCGILGLILLSMLAVSAYAESPAWVEAYTTTLEHLNAAAEEQSGTLGYGATCEYAVYDIDEDGTPELIVKTGTCEADYMGQIYTCRDGETWPVAQFGMGHSSLYTDPGENGLIVMYGHMGYAWADRLSLAGEGIIIETLYEDNLNERLETDPEAQYIYPASVVTGATYITLCPATLRLPLTHYDEISAFLRGDFPAPTEAAAPYFDYETFVNGDGEVLAVAGDAYSNSPGRIPFSSLLKQNVAVPYMERDAELVSIQQGNVNGDSSVEALVKLKKDDHSFIYCVLSSQGDTVYAYILNYMDDLRIAEDGGLVNQSEWGGKPSAYRLISEGKEAFLLLVEREADPLTALLNRLRDNVQPGTAGASLKAAGVAADFLDWAEQNPGASTDAAKTWVATQSKETLERLPEQLTALASSVDALANNFEASAGLMQDAGLTGRGPWSSEAELTVLTLLDGLK